MGKPPRSRLRNAEESTESGTASQYSSSHDMTRSNDGNGNFDYDGTAPDPGPLQRSLIMYAQLAPPVTADMIIFI